MMRIGREPVITRANTSRPSWSVPNQWALDGAWLIDRRFWARGSWDHGEPKIAARIQKPRMTTPTQNAVRADQIAEELPPADLGLGRAERCGGLDGDRADAHSTPW